ncbi:MAG: hypothetical protein DMD67_12080 [Gemmatimonadetes bacterium]|nr:MAG: hypothetical protein DMD67_12080 [Gemmatimonadota bacterium]
MGSTRATRRCAAAPTSWWWRSGSLDAPTRSRYSRKSAHVVAASVAPTIRRCPAVERLLETGARAGVSSSEDLSPAIAQDVAPIDDIRSSARYRNRAMARVLYHDLKDFWRPRA